MGKWHEWSKDYQTRFTGSQREFLTLLNVEEVLWYHWTCKDFDYSRVYLKFKFLSARQLESHFRVDRMVDHLLIQNNLGIMELTNGKMKRA
jgi:hypothetical protein